MSDLDVSVAVAEDGKVSVELPDDQVAFRPMYGEGRASVEFTPDAARRVYRELGEALDLDGEEDAV